MANSYIFLTTGFEETEALTTVDILRRADISVKMVSITGTDLVVSRNGITVKADLLYDENLFKNADALILPGGAVLDGYVNHKSLGHLIIEHAEGNKLVAAICAAPVYLAKLGLLKNRTAVCFPALENMLTENGVIYGNSIVEESDNFITSKGPATTPFFALAIVNKLVGSEVMNDVKKAFLIL